MKQTYIEFVCELVKKEKIGKPIYTNEIGDCIAKEYNITIKKLQVLHQLHANVLLMVK